MLLRLVPEKTDIKFLALRKVALVLSALLIVASIALFFSRGLNYGIDFKGGVNLFMQTSDGTSADVSRIRTISTDNVVGEVKVKEFGEKTDVLISIEKQPGGSIITAIVIAIMPSRLSSPETCGPITSED